MRTLGGFDIFLSVNNKKAPYPSVCPCFCVDLSAFGRMRSNATSERKTISWMRHRKAVWYSTFFVQTVSFSTHWSHNSRSHKTAQLQYPFPLTIGYCIEEINRIRYLCRRKIKRHNNSRNGKNGTRLYVRYSPLDIVHVYKRLSRRSIYCEGFYRNVV